VEGSICEPILLIISKKKEQNPGIMPESVSLFEEGIQKQFYRYFRELAISL